MVVMVLVVVVIFVLFSVWQDDGTMRWGRRHCLTPQLPKNSRSQLEWFFAGVSLCLLTRVEREMVCGITQLAATLVEFMTHFYLLFYVVSFPPPPKFFGQHLFFVSVSIKHVLKIVRNYFVRKYLGWSIVPWVWLGILIMMLPLLLLLLLFFVWLVLNDLFLF